MYVFKTEACTWTGTGIKIVLRSFIITESSKKEAKLHFPPHIHFYLLLVSRILPLSLSLCLVICRTCEGGGEKFKEARIASTADS